MAAPLIHVDGALTICARAHSLNTAGPTLAESGLAAFERSMAKAVADLKWLLGSYRPEADNLTPRPAPQTSRNVDWSLCICDTVEVCDQPGEQGNELVGLLICEATQCVTIALEQRRAGVRQAGPRSLRQRDLAAAPVGRVGHGSVKNLGQPACAWRADRRG